ncbi:hypothetical protein C1X72_00365 [Pseudomonas sp. FW306-2-2C-D06B]|nr:hypothetical protein C1X72_00365 [Pseudomonas sp. FW306-2-2C-D06B]PNA99187.1 hypothetical protein C1X74_09080 [Pseudomonas sp. GW460-5]PNB56937.1 hypothetical protein C1X73_17730 [Pseudomonas sp. FW305-130]
MSRKGREAAPAVFASALKSGGCFAALSRHKAAPATIASGLVSCGSSVACLAALHSGHGAAPSP